MTYAVLSFGFQGLLMMFDEFYFHRSRGLPLWEKLGHPLDTLSVLAVYLFMFIQAPSESAVDIVILLSLGSCLLITKDELIHSELCSGGENWVHSLLFLIHPVCFWTAAQVWLTQANTKLLIFQVAAVGLFLVYQIINWGFLEKNK